MPETDSTLQDRCRGQNGEAWKEQAGAAAPTSATPPDRRPSSCREVLRGLRLIRQISSVLLRLPGTRSYSRSYKKGPT